MADFTTHIGIRMAMHGATDVRTQIKDVNRDISSIGTVASTAMRNLNIGLAVATGAVGMLGGTFARQAREIRNFSRLSGTSVEEFQRWSVAAESVGISQEKLADQLKDFQERIGEFQETGGGPMLDFFEQVAPRVGLTIESFQNLSGPEGLMLFVSALEQLGMSQQQMSFYLEAMASDTTALIPLLVNGAKRLRELGDEAERTGRIMAAGSVEAAEELEKRLRELSGTATGLKNELVVQLLPALIGGLRTLNGAISTVGSTIRENETAFDLLTSSLGGAAVAGGVAMLATRLGTLGAAVGTLGTVLAANPAVLAFLGIGATVGALGAIDRAAMRTQEGIQDSISRLEQHRILLEGRLNNAVLDGHEANIASARADLNELDGHIRDLRTQLAKLEDDAARGPTGAGGGRGSVNPPTVGELNQREAQRQAQLRATYDALIGQSVKGTRQDPEYARQLKQLNEAMQAGVITAREFERAKGALDAAFSKGLPKRSVSDLERERKQLEDAAKTYLQRLQEQADGVEKLTEAERLLYEVGNGRMVFARNEDFQQALGYAKQIDAAERAAEAEEKLNKLKEEGRTLAESLRTPQETLAAQMQRYKELLDAGAISQETFNRAVQASEKAYAEATDRLTELDRFTLQFAENTQQQLGDGLYQVLSGNFESIGDSFKNMLLRMAADAAAADLTRALFGNVTESGRRSGGLVSGVIGAIGGLFGGGRANGGPVAAGRIYEVNERGVPEMLQIGNRDFLLMGRQSGRVTPPRAGGGAQASRSVVYSPTIHIDSRTDRAEVYQLVLAAEQRAQVGLVDKMNRGLI